MYLDASAYDAMLQQIIYRICQYESRSGDSGMKRSELFDWYIESQEDQITTEADLGHCSKLIRSVIHRMLTKDHSLLLLQTLEGEEEDGDPLLTVSPQFKNY